MFTFVSLPSLKNDQNKLQTYTFMKERLILFCMLLLCGIGVSRAQSGNAKDFDQKEEAIVQKLQQAVNEKNYKLRTQMNISGASASRWNSPIAQPATEQNKFVVLVQLMERPTALTPAGVYKDSLYINLMF